MYKLDADLHEYRWNWYMVCEPRGRLTRANYGCRKSENVAEICKNCAESGYTIENRPFFGHHIKSIQDANDENCQSSCDSTKNCVGFSMCIRPNGKKECSLKAGAFEELTEETNFTDFGCSGNSTTFSKQCNFEPECSTHTAGMFLR